MEKTYFSPESNEIEIKLMSTILVGSGDKGDGDPIMNNDENGDEDDGF